jgi:hypothetical protein
LESPWKAFAPAKVTFSPTHAIATNDSAETVTTENMPSSSSAKSGSTPKATTGCKETNRVGTVAVAAATANTVKTSTTRTDARDHAGCSQVIASVTRRKARMSSE